MKELLMPIVEYDAVLRSIMVGVTYQYRSTEAQILADKFEDYNMPEHATLFRDGPDMTFVNGGGTTYHPYYLVGSDTNEELVAFVHCRIIDRYKGRYYHGCYSALYVDPKSTLENPILVWY